MINSDQKSNIKLKDLRAKSNKTQRQLAEALGLRSQTISEWERGYTKPGISIRQTAILCRELNCTIDELADAVDLADESSDLYKEEASNLLVAA
jgi:transcriptional regulator with XRE-family HTH domain